MKVDGHDIMKEPEEAKRCIGYLPEMPPVYPDMTVQEYLRFAAELKGIGSGNLCTYKRMRLKKRDIALIVFSVILTGTCLVFEYISGGSFYGSMHG